MRGCRHVDRVHARQVVVLDDESDRSGNIALRPADQTQLSCSVNAVV
jgi:hypothetical protein